MLQFEGLTCGCAYFRNFYRTFPYISLPTAHQLRPGADMGAYIGAVLACDVGAEVVKLMVLPRHPALVAVAAVVCLPDTGSRDLLHPSDKGTGIWLTWPARKQDITRR